MWVVHGVWACDAPLDELREARAALGPLAGGRRDERGVRREEHARLQLLAHAEGLAAAVERLAAVVDGRVHAQVGQVADGVGPKVRGGATKIKADVSNAQTVLKQR